VLESLSINKEQTERKRQVKDEGKEREVPACTAPLAPQKVQAMQREAAAVHPNVQPQCPDPSGSRPVLPPIPPLPLAFSGSVIVKFIIPQHSGCCGPTAVKNVWSSWINLANDYRLFFWPHSQGAQPRPHTHTKY